MSLSKPKDGRTILSIATLNVSGLGGVSKKLALNSFLKNGDIDVLATTETCFYEGYEPNNLAEGYRSFYSSIAPEGRSKIKGGLMRAKWGVGVFTKADMKIGTITRGTGALKGRLISVSCAIDFSPVPLYIVGTYAPVSKDDVEAFWEDLDNFLKDNTKPRDKIILLGDLNCHLLSPETERHPCNPNLDGTKNIYISPLLNKYNLTDARTIRGDFDIFRDHTFQHFDGTRARLDYIIANDTHWITAHRTINCDRFATKHRAVIVELNLEVYGASIVATTPFTYPLPIPFDKEDTRVHDFHAAEDKWKHSLPDSLLQRFADTSGRSDTYISEMQDFFLNNLTSLCVDTAAQIWQRKKKTKYHFHDKALGIIMAQVTWIKKARKAARTLTEIEGGSRTLSCHQLNSVRLNLQPREDLAQLDASEWEQWDWDTRLIWRKVVARFDRALKRLRKIAEQQYHAKQHLKLTEWWAQEAAYNSKIFRRERIRVSRDPDGEAIRDSKGDLLTDRQQVRNRHGEYYSTLLGGEGTRLTPPNQLHRERWMDPLLLESNKSKLLAATQNVSLVHNRPTLEEVLAVIRKGSPTASGGPDRVQYGALQLLSIATVKAITGLIGWWWVQRKILNRLLTVEICSLHKKGDNFDLFNKRGIGLVSKFVLIMEMVLVTRMTKALAAAGTRSKAQGGTTPGTQTMDAVATVVNVIAKAKRLRKKLFIAEFDMFKFFDKIPHRAFMDAHIFFGFDDETINVAKLFWENFTATARSRYGPSDPFPVKIGNIQGLAGSPFRSCLVIDMFLVWLENQNQGFTFRTDSEDSNREHDLDDIILKIAGVAWIDDVWLMEEDEERALAIVQLYNDFVSYYSMRFVPEKCHLYTLNHKFPENFAVQIVDYQGVSGLMPVVYPDTSFCCLGAFFNMKLKWDKQYEEDQTKLRDFGALLSRNHSPPYATARLVNSNGISKITYALSLAEYRFEQLRLLQGLLIKPVKDDGGHSNRIRYDAYCMPPDRGGYGLANVSTIYKAAKVYMVHRLLNGPYRQAAITTQMHLLDLQRFSENIYPPLAKGFDAGLRRRRTVFPPFLYSVMPILEEANMQIIPKVNWDLTKITVRTFAKCISGINPDEGFFSALTNAGIVYMNQVSNWFTTTHDYEGFKCCKIISSIINGDTATKSKVQADAGIFSKVYLVPGVGDVRGDLVESIIRKGVCNIMDDMRRVLFVPLKIRLSNAWQDSLVARHHPQIAKVVSDGSVKDLAAFALVDTKLNLVLSSTIPGRPTSQRAEAFGILAATFIACTVAADPKFILDSVEKARNGSYNRGSILKLKNRSLIRKIAHNADRFGVSYEWVKGHQDNSQSLEHKMNVAADAQAKVAAMRRTAPVLQENWEFADDFVVLWKNQLFEGDVRKKVHNLLITDLIDQYSSEGTGKAFSRDGCWVEEMDKIDMLRHNAFLFKMATNNLPVHQILMNRWPGLYEECLCPGCGEGVETLAHVMNECPAYGKTRMDTAARLTSVLSSLCGGIQPSLQQLVANWVPRYTSGANSWFLGKIPLVVKAWILKNNPDNWELRTLWNIAHNLILEAAKEIWRMRCDLNKEKGFLWEDLNAIATEWRIQRGWESVQDLDDEIWEEQSLYDEIEHVQQLSQQADIDVSADG